MKRWFGGGLAALGALVGLSACNSGAIDGQHGAGAPGTGRPGALLGERPAVTSAAAGSAAASATGSAAAAAKPKVSRADFNRLAVHLALPVFWLEDGNGSGAPDADEIVSLWGVEESPPVWVEGGKRTVAFQAAYDRIAEVHAKGYGEESLSPEEKARRAAVRAELDQGRPAVIRWDFRSYSEEDRAIVRHVLAAAKGIERIYAKQQGTLGMEKDLAAGDTASRMLFYRNQSPFCEQPKTESDPSCNALPGKPKKVSGLYPASIQEDPKFCEALEKRKDAKQLFHQFSAVVEEKGELKAVPYTVVYKEEMTAISEELKKAADAITSKEEAPFKEYLLAASKAFLDNDWPKADEAWAKMNVTNSKWYLRIGPDEVYSEPCSQKAGFHVSFARINQDSLTWQKKLEPVKKEMEEALAKMAGEPYRARDVKFHLPDFIDIVLNAGDSRSAVGATIGQSLPNWGPVAEKGGRTVAMTNLYTDKDSGAALASQVSSVLCSSAMDRMSMDPGLLTMSTVLHEAAHNLGPAHEYKVSGKTDSEVFGGPLASTLEELKAQTSALYFVDWLADKGMIEKARAAESHVRDLTWAFGHIAQGMYDSANKPKPYSQLAAIQVGSLRKAGAVSWNAKEKAANGADEGCLAIDLSKFQPAIADLERAVLQIKAKGDKEAAVKMREELVDADGEWKKIREILRERWLRVPKTSFVYSIEL